MLLQKPLINLIKPIVMFIFYVIGQNIQFLDLTKCLSKPLRSANSEKTLKMYSSGITRYKAKISGHKNIASISLEDVLYNSVFYSVLTLI